MSNSKEDIRFIKFMAWVGWIAFVTLLFIVLTSTTVTTTQKPFVNDPYSLVHERSQAKNTKQSKDSVTQGAFNIKALLYESPLLPSGIRDFSNI